MNERKIIGRVVDPDTGEIINDIYEGDVILHEQEVIKNYNDRKRFVKLFDGINNLRKYLNNQGEFSTAVSLADYVCYLDCIIRKGGVRNGKKLGIEELSKELEIPYNTLKRNILSLNKKGIINYSKEGSIDNKYVGENIVVNPDIYLRGCNVNQSVIGLFENSGWKEYIEGVNKAKPK